MIVDLLRNDLGKVCEPRTVRVQSTSAWRPTRTSITWSPSSPAELPGVTASRHLAGHLPRGLHHRLPQNPGHGDHRRAGACVRQVYCGAIGYLGLHRNLDLNVAIRTAVMPGGQAHFAVGGGVVYDSAGRG